MTNANMTNGNPTAAAAPTLGYDRAAVDDFLGAAAAERTKLEEQIERSHLRLARARTALGTHRVMVAMLLQTQRELSALRRDAERDAAEIIAAADREARRREAAGPARTGTTPDPIDLRVGSLNATLEPTANGPAAAAATELSAADDLLLSSISGQDDEFFEYLRGALHDDEPLGPRSEEGSAR